MEGTFLVEIAQPKIQVAKMFVGQAGRLHDGCKEVADRPMSLLAVIGIL